MRNYFDVGVIGYGGGGAGKGLGGALTGSIVHPITALEKSPLRIEDRTRLDDDGAGGVLERKIKFPVWFDATASGGTPMCAVLTKAAEALVAWCDSHPQNYPPTVLHVTDGASTDGDPESIASAERQICTGDGECLLFNIHVSTLQGETIRFPNLDSGLGDNFTVESCRPIDVLRWNKLGYLQSPRWFSWIWTRDGERVASINVQTRRHSVTLKYRSRSYGEDWSDVAQRVTIAWTPCRFGGERPWFVCSVQSNGVYCGRQVTKLYGVGRLFACRHCYRLAYASQQESTHQRGLGKSQKIRMRLGGSPNMLEEFPGKPKGMHRRTYDRLCSIHDCAEERSTIGLMRFVDRAS